jgi:hypothetical protein
MTRTNQEVRNSTLWESVHKCPRCNYELNLEEIDLKGATTGMAVCPKCGWEGQINLQIVSSSEEEV